MSSQPLNNAPVKLLQQSDEEIQEVTIQEEKEIIQEYYQNLEAQEIARKKAQAAALKKKSRESTPRAIENDSLSPSTAEMRKMITKKRLAKGLEVTKVLNLDHLIKLGKKVV